jgi:hypothetical protein
MVVNQSASVPHALSPIPYPLSSVLLALSPMLYPLSPIPYALCSVLNPLCSVLCALRSVPYDPPLRLIRRQAASPVGCAASIMSCIVKPRVERNVDGRVWSLTLEMRPECAMDIQIGKATTKRAVDRGFGIVFLGFGVGFFAVSPMNGGITRRVHESMRQ